jgi:hypothetical protein
MSSKMREKVKSLFHTFLRYLETNEPHNSRRPTRCSIHRQTYVHNTTINEYMIKNGDQFPFTFHATLRCVAVRRAFSSPD